MIYWLDPGAARYLGTVLEDVANALANGTCPGWHGAIFYETNNTESKTRQGRGGKGALMSEDKSLTLATGNEQTLITDYVVRRLTPTECARLQGFPDDWCEGIPHGDSVEYKMWGNGMALPCALYVMEGAKEYFERNREIEGSDKKDE